MNDEKVKKPTFKWLEKLKKIKHIEIYISVIFIVIILLIYLSNFSKSSRSQTDYNQSNITDYIEQLEDNLEDVLSSIGGVSNVKVMITLDMASALIENSNITLNSLPDIKGVVVTAKGVNNTATKLKVLHAIEAVLDISNGSIEILSSE